jgi:multicomponent Na+:H+ antiporter subunit D
MMSPLPPLAIAVPLVGGAVVLIAGFFGRRWLIDVLATSFAAATAVVCALLLNRALSEPLVHWFGGWKPEDGVAIGVSFVVDPLGAGLALLVAVLVVASVVFTWRYFDTVHGLFHALTLVFAAGMIGFSLSGDLFNLFVFFELMTVAALALTGYKTAESEPLQGALNFGVVNGLGGFFMLSGVALLYARTGALNLAQIGQALSGKPVDALVLAAFVLIGVGLLTKAAMVPFHFWLADALAVAPSPICVLFSGVMVQLGLYGFARVYWTVFEGAFSGHEETVRGILVGFGVVTALAGGLLCLMQRHLKRLIAFSTVSHTGLFLIGIAVLSPLGVGGSAVFIASDGLLKGALFLSVGVLIHRFGTVDELDLKAKGKGLRATGFTFTAAGLALAGLPPFGNYVGKTMIEEAGVLGGFSWITWVLVLASAMTGGAVLRAAGRVFGGFGEKEKKDEFEQEETAEEHEPETLGAHDRTPWFMVAPALVLLAGALYLGVARSVPASAESAAATFVQRSSYIALTLEDESPVHHPPSAHATGTAEGALVGLLTTLSAVALAGAGLYTNRFPMAATRSARSLLEPLSDRVRALHSGHVGDYVAWLTLGTALLGGLFAAALL